MTGPKVSVIIPVHKKTNIDKLLISITNSSYKHIEIVTVNRGLERSVQRNIGIKEATGEYFLFSDSDWVLTPGLIKECVYLMRFFTALYIPEQIRTKGLFAKIRNWERQFYTATPIDAVRFVKRKDCPEFDETLVGPEDSDWDRRIKGSRTTTANCYYHYDNVNILSYFKKKAYYSKSMVRFKEKWPNDKILDFKWRCFGVFLEDGKWKRFISNPFMAMAVLFIIFIRGVIFLWNK